MKKRNPRIARGHWQAYMWDMLTMGYEVTPFRDLVGRARDYTDRYIESFHNMLERARAAGYKLESKSGPLGCMWGSSYRMVGRS